MKNRVNTEPFVNSAKYRPWIKLSVLRKISRNLDSPIGLYLRLNLSNRWNESACACMSRVSMERSYDVSLSDWKTCESVKSAPSRWITISWKPVVRIDDWKRDLQDYIWATFHLGLDETKEVFLIHAARVMNVRVDLSNVVKVPGRIDEVDASTQRDDLPMWN